MPFALLIIGIVLLIAAIRGTQSQLFSLVAGDFSGPNNFIFWAFSILVVGSIGYIPKAKPISTAFIVLAIVVLVLTRGNPNSAGGGFFQQLITQLKTTQTATPNATGLGSSLSNAFSFLGGSSIGSGSSDPFSFLTGSGNGTSGDPFSFVNGGSSTSTGTGSTVTGNTNPFGFAITPVTGLTPAPNPDENFPV